MSLGSSFIPLPHHKILGSNQKLDNYPDININCEALNGASISGSSLSPRYNDSWRNVLVPVNEGILKRIIRTYFESGFIDALNEARDTQKVGSNTAVASVAELSFRAMEFLMRLKLKVFPKSKEVGIACIAKHSETKDWIRSYIRCIAWHPDCFNIAVAGLDDIVRIYTHEPSIMPVLKSSLQKWITCMAWRPYATAELAVGCQKGICIWILDNNMHITRSTSHAGFLKHPNHSPITSLQWNKNGEILASASIGDTDVILWQIDNIKRTPLKRVSTTTSLLKMSPDGSSLFASTVTNIFRIWDEKWRSERWTINSGTTIQSACWSPCGNFLLFVCTEEPILYRLQFCEEQLFQNSSSQQQAFPIADLTKTTVDNDEIGGQPQCIAWDPNGIYLAITFKDSPCIVIYRTAIHRFKLTISPSCYLAGYGNEVPSYICFQSINHKNSDSILTIGWSSGRIQYFPFVDL